MTAVAEYRCRLCGSIYRVGDPVEIILDNSGAVSNIAIDVSTSRLIVTKSIYPREEIHIPLMKYHSCKDGNIGIADFAGFMRWG